MTANRTPRPQTAGSAPRECLRHRELLYGRAWTDPKHAKLSWVPIGFTITTKEYDLRPGGKWLHTMHGPDGTDYRNDIVFTEVIEPELIEYFHGPTPVFRVTARFLDEGSNRARLLMRMLFPNKEERDHTVELFGAIEGQRQTLNRLEVHLASIGT